MENTVLIIERTFKAQASVVWKALTDKNEMKKWYFDPEAFKAEEGFKFQFKGGPEDGIQYIHLCEVTEVIPGKKLTYSWRYEGYEGISFVSFELRASGDETTLTLAHSGIESFPKHPDFYIGNFREGWNHIVNISLQAYLEENS